MYKSSVDGVKIMASNKKSSYDPKRAWRHIDIVRYMFVLYMSSFFLVYMDNKYFNITATRNYVFLYGVLGLLVLSALAVTVEIFMNNYYGGGSMFTLDCKIPAMPDFWACLFLVANVCAFFMATDKAAAYDGSKGRRMGLLMISCLVLSFLILARKVYVNKINLYILAGVTAFAYVLSYLQHFGMDPFDLIRDITQKQKQLFISTFGNINTFGSFICIATPLFAAIVIYSKKLDLRIISGIIVIMSSMAMLASKSDNVYLGIGTAFLLLLFISIKDKKLVGYWLSVTLLSLGLFIMTLIKARYGGSEKHINGIAKLIGDWRITGALFGACLVVFVILLLLEKMNGETFGKFQGRTLMIVLAVLIVIAGVGLFILGRKSGKTDLFTFNDKWGTYRGYIWRRLVSIYKESGFLHKLFGHGNESIAEIMKPYYDEMVSVTGKSYDNAHNEVIHYLLTTGLFGAISYIGFFVSSLIFMLRRYKADPVVTAMMAAGVGYFFQGLVNLNQPITTPIFFTVLGVGVGYIRYRDEGFGIFRETKQNSLKNQV